MLPFLMAGFVWPNAPDHAFGPWQFIVVVPALPAVPMVSILGQSLSASQQCKAASLGLIGYGLLELSALLSVFVIASRIPLYADYAAFYGLMPVVYFQAANLITSVN